MRRKLFMSYEGPERQLNEREYWIDFMLNQAGRSCTTTIRSNLRRSPISCFMSGVQTSRSAGQNSEAERADDDGDASTTERRKPGPQSEA